MASSLLPLSLPPSNPHQDILEFDVPVQQGLTVQKADPLHHVHSDLHPGAKVQPHLEGSVQVPGILGHDEQHHHLRPIGIVVIYQCTNQVHHTVVLGESPGGERSRYCKFCR